MYSYQLPIDTYGLSVTVFELFSWLQTRFSPSPARPSDPDTMRNTALEAIASSSGKYGTNRYFFLNGSFFSGICPRIRVGQAGESALGASR